MFETQVSKEARDALSSGDPFLRVRAMFALEELAKLAEAIVPGSDGWRGLFGASARKVEVDVGRALACFEVSREARRVKLRRIGRAKSGASSLPLWRTLVPQFGR
ncbi:MAG: hypothetical protein JNK82_13985 [Myxococcaceae bacterium]|nr:hypothetical protein [Myxococcaceae bacterium]